MVTKPQQEARSSYGNGYPWWDMDIHTRNTDLLQIHKKSICIRDPHIYPHKSLQGCVSLPLPTGSGLCWAMWIGLSAQLDPDLDVSDDGTYVYSLHSVILDGEEPGHLYSTLDEAFASIHAALAARAQLGLPLRTLTLDPVFSTSPDDLVVHEAALLDALQGSGTNLTFFPRQVAKSGGSLGMANRGGDDDEQA